MKNISNKIDKLREEIIATAATALDLADTRYESKKANEQAIKVREAWNDFLDEWEKIKPRLKKTEESSRTESQGSEFPKLASIVKKMT